MTVTEHCRYQRESCRSGISIFPDKVIAHIGSLASLTTVACLARVSHRFHNILNPILYTRNLTEERQWNSCIVRAARLGCLETIKLAHSRYGASLHAIGEVEDQSSTTTNIEIAAGNALHIAIYRRDQRMIEWLLDSGMEVNMPCWYMCGCDNDGDPTFRTLHMAIAHREDDELAVELIQRGADRVSAYLPELHAAAGAGKLRLVNLLLERSDVNNADLDSFGRTALHHAISLDDESTAHMIALRLIENAVPVNVVDQSNRTALRIATEATYYVLALCLIAYGADPMLDFGGNSSGWRSCLVSLPEPNSLQKRIQKRELIESIIEHGIDIRDLC